MSHPWHDLSPGEAVPKEFNAVIEIPLRSNVKYELDKSTGIIRMDRVLYSAVFYPANHGFIPKTLADASPILSTFWFSARNPLFRSLSSIIVQSALCQSSIRVHYCKVLPPEPVIECLIYESTDPGARLE